MPSGCGSARVEMSASDEPACGSDRHMVPKKRPSTMGLTQRSICSGEAWASSRLALAWVRKGYPAVPTLAAWNHAVHAALTTWGNCSPPTDSSMLAASRPVCQNASSAGLTSSARWTRSPSNVGSCASAVLLCGAKCSVATCSETASAASKVSRECSA